jgi:hypothetical protein
MTEPEWQPIETAPKDKSILAWDGELVLLVWWDAKFDHDDEAMRACDYEKTIYRGAWTDGRVEDWGMETNRHYNPTHWMPLPQPPKLP